MKLYFFISELIRTPRRHQPPTDTDSEYPNMNFLTQKSAATVGSGEVFHLVDLIAWLANLPERWLVRHEHAQTWHWLMHCSAQLDTNHAASDSWKPLCNPKM